MEEGFRKFIFLHTILNPYFLSHFARVGDLFLKPPRGVENLWLKK